MTVRVFLLPENLYESAKAAKARGQEAVLIAPDALMRSAEAWFRDQEKIKYLESLIVRIGRT
jgi:hypothetical protein